MKQLLFVLLLSIGTFTIHAQSARDKLNQLKADNQTEVTKTKPQQSENYQWQTGKRGGVYRINEDGNRIYKRHVPEGVTIETGPRGGKFYRNKEGQKVYVARE